MTSQLAGSLVGIHELGGVSAPDATSAGSRAIIVHAQADDLRTQPTGNSGARLGAGVIGIAAP